ncbi:hypothetical protein AAVH_21582 [Aphelenchoides avenae]|nr:hypothetical protein AAVH_21582 [Aphelenchus avenae]
MDRSSGTDHLEGTFAQWEAFFRSCGIPPNRSQLHAAKFVNEYVRPHKLSTYTTEDYKELDVKQGDRKVIEEYLKGTNWNPPEFAERKPTVRPTSASDDDIIWEPAPNVAVLSSGPERKPLISQRHGLPGTSTRRCSLFRSATAPPTSITSIANTSSTGCSDSDKIAASPVTPSPDRQLTGDARNAVIETVPDVEPSAAARIVPPETNPNVHCPSSREALPCNIIPHDNIAGEDPAAMASASPASDISHVGTERPLSVDETAPSPLSGNTSATSSTLAVPLNKRTVDIRRIRVDRKEGQDENYQRPESNGARSELTEKHAERSQHDRPNSGSMTSVKTGKLRLSRPTAAARRSKTPPPMEMVHEDVFPPPELRNAHHQISIDQLRRNGQLVEHEDEIGEVSVQTDWGETEPIGIETPTDEPIEAVSINATLINHGVGHLADAMQISRQSSAGRPMKPPSSRVAKNKEVRLMPSSGNGRIDFDDDAEPSGRTPRTPREDAVGFADDEPSERRTPGERNPSRGVQDSESRRRTRFAGKCQSEQLPTTEHANQDGNYKCDTCGRVFGTQRGLAVHGRRCGAEEHHKCDECGRECVNRSALLKHKQIHTDERPFECDECDKRFKRQDDLEGHKRMHKPKPFECPDCGMSFYRKYILTVHSRRHTGEKPYECEECGGRFNNYGSFVKHMKRHTGRKPHECEVCGKAFAYSGHLLVHKRTHTGEKPYKCEECSASFAASTTLKSHKRRHHGA